MAALHQSSVLPFPGQIRACLDGSTRARFHQRLTRSDKSWRDAAEAKFALTAPVIFLSADALALGSLYSLEGFTGI